MQVSYVLEDPSFSPHERSLALEALLWGGASSGGGADAPRPVSPQRILAWASRGGRSVPLEAQATFADPWPADILASLLRGVNRRLSAAGADDAGFWLACASAVVMACPSRIPHEAITATWEAGLRLPAPEAKAAALRAVAEVLHGPLPPIAVPPSDAALEAKTLAAREEAAGAAALARSLPALPLRAAPRPSPCTPCGARTDIRRPPPPPALLTPQPTASSAWRRGGWARRPTPRRGSTRGPRGRRRPRRWR